MRPPFSKAEIRGCCVDRPKETRGFIFHQTTLRVKDPRKSLKFYTGALGMQLLQKLDVFNLKFSLYFLDYTCRSEVPVDHWGIASWCYLRKSTLELVHNWGTENDPNFAYTNGDSRTRGFGHMGLAVPNVIEACARFERLGVEFQKKPGEGPMKGIAFIVDPDGYWIEILQANTMKAIAQ